MTYAWDAVGNAQVHQTSQHHPGLRLPGDLCKLHLGPLGQWSSAYIFVLYVQSPVG